MFVYYCTTSQSVLKVFWLIINQWTLFCNFRDPSQNWILMSYESATNVRQRSSNWGRYKILFKFKLNIIFSSWHYQVSSNQLAKDQWSFQQVREFVINLVWSANQKALWCKVNLLKWGNTRRPFFFQNNEFQKRLWRGCEVWDTDCLSKLIQSNLFTDMDTSRKELNPWMRMNFHQYTGRYRSHKPHFTVLKSFFPGPSC